MITNGVQKLARETLNAEPLAKKSPGDVHGSLIVVGECYAEWMYFHYFENEIRELRNAMIIELFSPSRLRQYHQESGFWGIQVVL